jgi:hypothetical protein
LEVVLKQALLFNRAQKYLFFLFEAPDHIILGRVSGIEVQKCKTERIA